MVISNSEYNAKTEDVIVLAVTSNIREKDYSILFTNSDMVEGNIKVNSCIRADKIYTLSKAMVIRKFGTVKAEVIEKVKKRIAYWINDNDK